MQMCIPLAHKKHMVYAYIHFMGKLFGCDQYALLNALILWSSLRFLPRTSLEEELVQLLLLFIIPALCGSVWILQHICKALSSQRWCCRFMYNCVHIGMNANVWIYVYVSACDYECLIDLIGNVMDQENLTVCMSTPISICIMHTYIMGIHII